LLYSPGNRGWSKAETARAALQAGTGPLIFGVVVWIVGAAVAQSFGRIIDTLASVALIGFGLWIAVGSWRELRAGSPGDSGRHHQGHAHNHDHHHRIPILGTKMASTRRCAVFR
jgi:ABC-type nickel/cobalt efflux system permease component RcnA